MLAGPFLGALTAAVLVAPAVRATSDEILPGVVVESAQRGFVADRGGIRAGDVLVSWSSEAGDRQGSIASPLLMTDLEYGELPRGPIVLMGMRAGAPLEVTVSADAVGLGLKLRPRFPPAVLALYQRGRTAIESGQVAEGASIWRAAAARARAMEGGRSAGCWLLGKAGDAWAVAREAERAHEAYDDATVCAEEGDPQEVATILQWQAEQAFELGQASVTRAALETAFGLLDGRPGSPPLAVVPILFGRFTAHPNAPDSRGVLIDLLDLAERHAPDSLLVARVLLYVGLTQQLDGDYDAAEQTFTRAAAIVDTAGPWSTTWARAQTAVGGLVGSRGDGAKQEDLFRKAAEQLLRLQPDSTDTARALVNLSAVTNARGDPEAAVRWARAALRVLQRQPTGRAIRAAALNNLGRATLSQGDLAEAEGAFQRALAEISALNPDSPSVSTVESNLAEAKLARGDVPGARRHADRGMEQAARVLPRSTTMVEALMVRGDVARREGDWDVAADCYTWALEVLEDLGSEAMHVGRGHEGLASVARHRGDAPGEERHLRQAMRFFESKRSGMDRPEEERSLFASSFHGVYRDLTALLVEQGRVKEAFEVLEASRARSLRSMVAARDLHFDRDVPPEQERERRALESAHARARQQLARLPPEATAQAGALRGKVDALHERLLGIEARISRGSPRLAALREPETMSPAAVAASLPADTLLLAYSTGAERTVVIALGARGEDTLEAHLLPVGEDALRERIARWRTLAQASPPGPRFRADARALYELLLGPISERLRGAKRLVVSVDGPLHGLPFAALRDERGFLAESKAIAFAPSASFYAQQAGGPVPRTWSGPVAFADPVQPAKFPPLPGSRREVASVAAAFPDTRTYLGRDASQGTVEALPRGGRFVHFAVHGIADHRAPLDSALVLSATAGEDPGDGGLLHAWEVFERVRLDADLVTLSACDSADGADRPGEGTIGLTRAFLYAGARSVVASLWGVGDAAAGPFMRTFYERWARGEPKAEALRRAQVDAIRRGQRPLRWAAFQLYGDDR